MTCAECRIPAYCNAVCQYEHWVLHKPICKAARPAAVEKAETLHSFVKDRIASLDKLEEYNHFFEKICALLVEHLSKEYTETADRILEIILADYWSGLDGPIQILMNMDPYFTDTLCPAIKSIILDYQVKAYIA
jgi:hypothetical protein